MKKKMALAVAAAGFLLMLGTGCASDADMLSMTGLLVRGGVAVGVLVGGMVAVSRLERQEIEADAEKAANSQALGNLPNRF